jgi:hypothetical protein
VSPWRPRASFVATLVASVQKGRFWPGRLPTRELPRRWTMSGWVGCTFSLLNLLRPEPSSSCCLMCRRRGTSDRRRAKERAQRGHGRGVHRDGTRRPSPIHSMVEGSIIVRQSLPTKPAIGFLVIEDLSIPIGTELTKSQHSQYSSTRPKWSWFGQMAECGDKVS